jgi:hypothetical protein
MSDSLRPYLWRSAALLVLLGAHGGCKDQCGEEPPPAVDDDDTAPVVVPDRGSWLDMDIDADGRVWISYRNIEDTALFVARGTGDPIEFTHWPVEGKGALQGGLLVGNFDAGQHSTIKVGADGRAHVAHYDGDEKRLRYAVGSGSDWAIENVDTGLDVGMWASIGLSGGQPVIAYYDAAFGDLKFAAYDGSDWSIETIDDGEASQARGGAGDDDDSAAGDDDTVEPPTPAVEADVGQYADLVVADDGQIWIAYYDATNGDLKVARGSAGSWSVNVWASEGNVGAWPSLAAAGGEVAVSFHDVDNGNLLFGQWTGTNLPVEVADNGTFVGADSSLVLVGGDPVIAYQDARNNDTRIARKVGGEWTVTTHMSDGAVGFHNNLAVGPDGRFNWSCFNHTTNKIVFQRFE